MALRNTFANQQNAQMVWLDQNFADLGAIDYIPCTASGTNTLALTPRTNTPTVDAYANGQGFTAIIPNTNTASITAQVGALGALQCYKPTAGGPTSLVGGDAVQNTLAIFVYDSTLNGGNGGFHVLGIGNPPNPGASQRGGVLAYASVDQQFLIAITTSGNPQSRRLIFADISGGASASAIILGAFTLAGNQTAASAGATPVTVGGLFSFAGTRLQSIAFTGDVGSPANSAVLTIAPPKDIALRTVAAGAFLSGGGLLSADRTLSLAHPARAGVVLIGTSNSGWAEGLLLPGSNVTVTTGDGTVTINANLGGGTVAGPGVSVDGNVAMFSGTDGSIIKELFVASAQLGLKNRVGSWLSAQGGVTTALSGLGNVDVDFSRTNNFSIAGISGIVLTGIFNAGAGGSGGGQSGVIAVTQGSSGNCAVSFSGPHWKFAGGSSAAPTATLTANARDLLTYYTLSSSAVFIAVINTVKGSGE